MSEELLAKLQRVEALVALTASSKVDDADVIKTGLWQVDELLLEMIHQIEPETEK